MDLPPFGFNALLFVLFLFVSFLHLYFPILPLFWHCKKHSIEQPLLSLYNADSAFAKWTKIRTASEFGLRKALKYSADRSCKIVAACSRSSVVAAL
jgi:hypothetical protein